MIVVVNCKRDSETYSIEMKGTGEDMSKVIPGILYAIGAAEQSGVQFQVNMDTDEQDEPTTWQREMALYEDAVEKFGDIAQIMQAIEEMAELIQALNKYIRNIQHGQGSREHVLEMVNEERADVSIMLNQLDVIFGDNSEKELEKLAHLAYLLNKTK